MCVCVYVHFVLGLKEERWDSNCIFELYTCSLTPLGGFQHGRTILAAIFYRNTYVYVCMCTFRMAYTRRYIVKHYISLNIHGNKYVGRLHRLFVLFGKLSSVLRAVTRIEEVAPDLISS